MVVAVVVAVTVEGMVAVVAGRAARVTCDLPIRIVLNESMSSDHAVHDADVHCTVAARGSEELRRIAPELRQNCARIAQRAWSITSQREGCAETTVWYVASCTSMDATTAANDGRCEPGGAWYTSAPKTIVGTSRTREMPWAPGWTLWPPSFRLSLRRRLA